MARRKGKTIYEIQNQMERIRKGEEEIQGRMLRSLGSPNTALMSVNPGITAIGSKRTPRGLLALQIGRQYLDNIQTKRGVDADTAKKYRISAVSNITKKALGGYDADKWSAAVRKEQDKRYSRSYYANSQSVG